MASAPSPSPASSTISLPKGGGAIRGIGEKFGANPATGTGKLSIPISTSPGRSGFAPQLTLSYDSGSGNGPFGLGWDIGLPAVSRKTDKGLPRYRDDEETDVFLLSGAEDLVPVIDAAGTRHEDLAAAPGYRIHRYRPRTEGLFARIERWSRLSDGDVHWRSLSPDNILTLYGSGNESRIADPLDATRVFSWLICESRDNYGNAIVYTYAAEDGEGAPLASAHQRHRGAPSDPRRGANRHIKSIRYGNRVPLLGANGRRPAMVPRAQIDAAGWMFEVVFDYGDHDPDRPLPAAGKWTYRRDPFSTYRAGFEVRTCRLCRRVLSFHHFKDEAGVGLDCLVRSTNLHHAAAAAAGTPHYSYLTSVVQSGHVRDAAGGYQTRSLPPVDFTYTTPQVDAAVHEIDAQSLENLPVGLDHGTFQWIDLHGEGLPGVVYEQSGAVYYARNLSPITPAHDVAGDRVTARFAPIEAVAAFPNQSLAAAQIMDLAGDGLPDLVVLDGPAPGLYEHDDNEGWKPFRAFTSRPTASTRDPNARFLDLDGDGHADLLITEDDAFTWHPSLGEEGFGPARQVRQAFDEDAAPRVVFAEVSQSIYLADMSGDGLTDIVRIRNGDICYWPNLGYGQFGAKVTMDGAPLFDRDDTFDAKRLRVADIDGTGTSDLIYLHGGGVRLYFNDSGNCWSQAHEVPAFPDLDDRSFVTAIDLLGIGTACLVWSSPLPGDARRQMRYVDLMGGRKPHLLAGMRNNLGAETLIHYASSTKAYLEDKQAGRPWITRLPFPVHTVERVETIDRISGSRLVTRYAYHHGYFDGVEREFRGFGLVEQWDTDGPLAAPGLQQPAVLTRTWFHTGAWAGGERVSAHHAANEYYRPPGLTAAQAAALLLPDTILPGGLTAEEEREACRALRGTLLRREVYAVDGTAASANPYTVLEQNSTVRCVQRRAANRHGVFLVSARESLSYHYERDPGDARRVHELTLQVDDFGNVQKSASVGYGRKVSPLAEAWDRDRQTAIHVTFTDAVFTNAVDSSSDYRTPLPARTRTYHLTGCTPSAGDRFSFEDWTTGNFAMVRTAAPIPYEALANPAAPQLRPIEDVFTRYRSDDLASTLPIGQVEALAAVAVTAKLALTPALIDRVMKRPRPGQPDQALLPAPAPILESAAADGGGYLSFEGGWWVPSSRSFFDPLADAGNPGATAAAELALARQHFFLMRKAVDPFGHESSRTFDAYDLLPILTEDAAGNRVAAANDYRLLQPALVTDANRNRTAAAFDALGFVVATAVMGKAEDQDGDELNGFSANLTTAAIQAFAADPRGEAGALIGNATSRVVYDLDRFARCGQPSFAATIVRDKHVHDPSTRPTNLRVAIAYSDGFSREIQSKIPAEPGNAPSRGAAMTLASGDMVAGPLVRDAGGGVVVAAVTERWVGTGRAVFNNKGNPVRKYEPFFSATPLYEPEPDMTDTGVSDALFYDPLDRVVATLHPDHTYDKVVFDAWMHATYDVNDTVLLDPSTDPHVSAFFVHPDGSPRTDPGEYRPTWHALRTSAANAAGLIAAFPDQRLRDAETEAAARAQAHADTPSRAYLDSLGRTFMTTADNGPDPSAPGPSRIHVSRIEFDVEGNRRAVRDAKHEGGDRLGRIVMRFAYDMLGNVLRSSNMEAGERWSLADVTGKPIRAWSSRDLPRRMTYDALRRPTGLYVSSGAATRLAEETVYGDARGDALNHRGRIYKMRDAAGELVSVAYDFKGNVVESRRELLPDYAGDVDWQSSPATGGGTFTVATAYDALNRPLNVTSPDASIHQPSYNEANLLDRMEVRLRGSASATAFVTNVDYDAKGQRERIAYGNGAETTVTYDPLTSRVRNLRTTRPSGANGFAGEIFVAPSVVQDLHYTYDPAGNVTRIEDRALKTVVRGGQTIAPICTYRYDPMYRLVEATGREHIGQNAHDFNGAGGTFRDYPFAGPSHPNDLTAVRNYTQHYRYDEEGNFEFMRHVAAGGGWTRTYEHLAPSLVEAAKHSNRVTGSTVGNGLARVEAYIYDDHGNTTTMPHLAAMSWDFKDQLTRVDLGGGGTAYYVYDSSGQRVRKVIESSAGVKQKERIYVGGFEVYREFAGPNPIRRETLHVMDDKQRIAIVETETDDAGAEQAPPVIRYQFSNHLGSAVVELADDASLISYEEYHPYGTSAFQARSTGEISLKRYRHSGKERDEETGFNYHGARYLAVHLGRWISADPVGIADGVNVYRYVANRPLMLVDPSGTQGEYYTPDPQRVRTLLGRMQRKTDAMSFLEGRELGLRQAAGTTRLRIVGGGAKSVPSQGANALLAHTHVPIIDPHSGPSAKWGADMDVLRNQVRGDLDPATKQFPARRGYSGGGPRDHAIHSPNDRTHIRMSKSGNQARVVTFKPDGSAIVENLAHDPKAGTPGSDWTRTNTKTVTGARAGLERARSVMQSPLGEFAAQSGGGKGTAAMTMARKGLETSAKGAVGGLAVFGAVAGGVQVGGGINKMIEGDTAMGGIDVAEGSANLGMSIGTGLAVKSGVLVAEGGIAAGSIAAAAGLAAGASVMLAAETARAAVNGEETPIDVADKFYGTHFGNIAGWIAGDYSND